MRTDMDMDIDLDMDKEITLQEVLAAREARAARQRLSLDRFHAPLISFSMNIAGPVKNSALIRRAFYTGAEALQASLEQAGLPILYQEKVVANTGCEALYAVRGSAQELKQLCMQLEDASPLGRLFDMDVLTADGRKIEREELGGTERSCIVCGLRGRGCASRRIHTVAELQEATHTIMVSHFAAEDRRTIASLVTQALIDEVCTTPKPGLVDLNNNGSHRDMTVETFRASADALRPYWERCMALGQESAALSPEKTFPLLRLAGQAAEGIMLEATHGVNTHKGAIYLFGILCGALGRLWSPESPCMDVDRLLRECAAMTYAAARADFSAVSAVPEDVQTAGQMLYLRYGISGARGEVAAGFPSVRKTSLPVFQNALSAGYSRNDAGVYALLALIALGRDTNMIARGGMDTATSAVCEVSELLKQTDFPPMEKVLTLDHVFIRENLSPGGCADLLAVTLFLHDMITPQQINRSNGAFTQPVYSKE